MNTNPKAKRILCYGDSNTWGQVPNVHARYGANARYTGVLQDALGTAYEVVEEGRCGRTLAAQEPSKPHRTGITHLQSILESHDPLDVVTIMLGTNDMKSIFNLTPEDIAEHLRQTVQFIQNAKVGPEEGSPRIIVICPPPVVNPEGKEVDVRLKDAPQKSLRLPDLYKQVVDETGCAFLNAGDFISLEKTDGYHLGEEHHRALGQRLKDIIQND